LCLFHWHNPYCKSCVQELEGVKQEKMKLEEDLQKVQGAAEEERDRQKQIVLLLLADRRKVIIKYIEERKRSEDLAQVRSSDIKPMHLKTHCVAVNTDFERGESPCGLDGRGP
jgi:hypothetical protein